MNSGEFSQEPPTLKSADRSSGTNGFRRIFVGKQGIRAGWSVLIFVAIFLILAVVTSVALGHFGLLPLKGPIQLKVWVFFESCQVLVVLAATWVMARIERRRLVSFGFAGSHKVTRLVSNAILGFLSMSVLIGALWKMGFLVFDGQSLTGFVAWEYALGWALGFLLVGVAEESLLRGYIQYALSRGIGFWWAALVLSVAFGALHMLNGGESPIGLFLATIGGLIFCLSLWYTGSLWWAVGFHAGWDWGQSYFYGAPDSSLTLDGHLLAGYPSGNPLWSGGVTGPEGSLLVLPLTLMVAAGMWIWWGRRTRTPQENMSLIRR